MIQPAAGTLLIADPFLKDPNFMRTVVFMCEHEPVGSFGFIINKLVDHTLDQLLNGFEGYDFPVYYGGPVQMDTIHFLHQYANEIPGGVEVMKGVFWSGDFEILSTLLKSGRISRNKIRFFLGYSGWAPNQLDTELKEKTWLTAVATRKLVYHENPDDIWKDSLKHLGGDYEMMVNFPIDPQLN